MCLCSYVLHTRALVRAQVGHQQHANLLELETGHGPSDSATRAGTLVAKRHPPSTIQRGHGVVDFHLRAGKKPFEGGKQDC